jgi:hypothetical protein
MFVVIILLWPSRYIRLSVDRIVVMAFELDVHIFSGCPCAPSPPPPPDNDLHVNVTASRLVLILSVRVEL